MENPLGSAAFCDNCPARGRCLEGIIRTSIERTISGAASIEFEDRWKQRSESIQLPVDPSSPEALERLESTGQELFQRIKLCTHLTVDKECGAVSENIAWSIYSNL